MEILPKSSYKSKIQVIAMKFLNSGVKSADNQSVMRLKSLKLADSIQRLRSSKTVEKGVILFYKDLIAFNSALFFCG